MTLKIYSKASNMETIRKVIKITNKDGKCEKCGYACKHSNTI